MLSANYYSHLEDTVRVAMPEHGMDALTLEAREIYEKDNENFGLHCGDNYISSYQEGALYAFSVQAAFESDYDKQLFLNHSSAFTTNSTAFDIVTAVVSMNHTIYEHDIRGSMSLLAF